MEWNFCRAFTPCVREYVDPSLVGSFFLSLIYQRPLCVITLPPALPCTESWWHGKSYLVYKKILRGSRKDFLTTESGSGDG